MAFQPVQYAGGNRAYVQGNVVRPDIGPSSGGFASLGRGLGDLAYGAGMVGQVIDNWGAGKRAAARQRDADFAARGQYFHPDQIDAVLNDPETLQRWADAAGYSDVDKFRGQLEMAKYANTQERAKMVYQEGLNPNSPHFIMGESDGHQGPPGEVVDQPPEVSPEQEFPEEENLSSQETEEEFVGPTQEQAGLEEAPPAPETVYDPALEEAAELQFDEYQAQLEDEQLPSTNVDMENEYLALQNPQMKIPNPTRLQEVGTRGSKAVMDYMNNQKVYAHMIYGQAINGNNIDPKTANEVAMRMNLSQEALADGMRAYALEHMSHIPPDQAEFFNDPQYFIDGVAFHRYMTDREYARQIDSKPGEYERIVESVKKFPFLFKKVFGPAIEGTAARAQEQGLEYIDRDIQREAQADVRNLNRMNFDRDIMQIGIQQQEVNMRREELKSKLHIADAQLEMQWEKHGLENQDLYRRWEIADATMALDITDRMAKMHTQIWTNQNQMYQTIASFANVEGQTPGGKMLVDLMQAEIELATAAKDASAKYHPSDTLEGSQPDQSSTFNAVHVKQLQTKVEAMRNKIISEYGAAGLKLYVSPGQEMIVDVNQDLSFIRDEMFKQMGYDRNWIATQGRYLDKVRDQFVVSEGSGSVYVPPKLASYYDAAIRSGRAIQPFDSEATFRGWLGEKDLKKRDVGQLWKYHKLQVERQRRLLMDEGKYN